MRHPVKSVIVVLGLSLLVSACSWFSSGEEGVLLNPKDDYLDARQDNQLVVPDDLQDLADTDPFPIPATPVPQNPVFYPDKPPLPDAIYANDNRDEVRIQRLGTRSWLVVPEPPTTAWPKIKQFLAENGVALALDNPEVGRLNTEWLRIEQTQYRDVVRAVIRDAKNSVRLNLGQDRYLLKVEQGLRPRTTEVHIRYENDSAILPARDDIVALTGLQSHIAQAEDDLLNEIGAYVAAKVAQQTVSKVALQIGSQQKAELARTPDGYPVLKLHLDYERAWATLGQALSNADVAVAELNREAGVLLVNIPPEAFGEEQGRGFFCRITFSCDDKDDTLDVRLVIDGEEDNYSVSVLQPDSDAPIPPDLSQQVLVLIREYAA
ncbi:MAG: outer membrane protein assembly factor BamC [Pseudomonadota bacterium]